MSPTISVIIPTHYRNDLLPDAIESVAAQDYDSVELLVVDDSGEGHAEPILDEYADVIDETIVKDENGGWQAAYTSGIEVSTGEYVQLLDDDDRLLDGKLTKTAAVLQENPDVGVSYCGVLWDDEPHLPKPGVSGDILDHALAFQTFPLWTGSMLMERDVLTDCMPFAGMAPDDDLDIELGDTDLKIELARRTKFDYVDEVLVFYRRGDNKLWTGSRRFEKVMQNVRHQQELYEQYPGIRRELFSSWHQKQGRYLLEQNIWSPTAIYHFLKATYYADGTADRLKCSLGTVASMFGHPGWVAAERVRNIATGH